MFRWYKANSNLSDFGVMITGVLSYLISPYVGSLNQTISVFIGSMDIVYKLI